MIRPVVIINEFRLNYWRKRKPICYHCEKDIVLEINSIFYRGSPLRDKTLLRVWRKRTNADKIIKMTKYYCKNCYDNIMYIDIPNNVLEDDD